MTETRRAELPERLDANLRELESELERRRMDIAVLERRVEALRLLREALAQRESGAGDAAEARAASSPWFQEVLAAVWTAF